MSDDWSIGDIISAAEDAWNTANDLLSSWTNTAVNTVTDAYNSAVNIGTSWVNTEAQNVANFANNAEHTVGNYVNAGIKTAEDFASTIYADVADRANSSITEVENYYNTLTGGKGGFSGFIPGSITSITGGRVVAPPMQGGAGSPPIGGGGGGAGGGGTKTTPEPVIPVPKVITDAEKVTTATLDLLNLLVETIRLSENEELFGTLKALLPPDVAENIGNMIGTPPSGETSTLGMVPWLVALGIVGIALKFVGDPISTLYEQGVHYQYPVLQPEPPDVFRFADRKISIDSADPLFTDATIPPEAVDALRYSNIPEQFASMLWQAHYLLPSPGEMADMMYRFGGDVPDVDSSLVTTRDDFIRLLTYMGYPAPIASRIVALSEPVLPLRTLHTLYQDGIINDSETVVKELMRLGWRGDRLKWLTDYVLKSKGETTKALSASVYYQDYADGVTDAATLTKDLQGLGYSLENAVDLAGVQVRKKAKAAAKAAALSKKGDVTAIKLSESEILEGLTYGLTTADETFDLLQEKGYSPDEAAFLVALTQAKAVKAAPAAKAAATQTLKNVNDYVKAFEAGSITVEEFRQGLTDLKQLPAAIDKLVATLTPRRPAV